MRQVSIEELCRLIEMQMLGQLPHCNAPQVRIIVANGGSIPEFSSILFVHDSNQPRWSRLHSLTFLPGDRLRIDGLQNGNEDPVPLIVVDVNDIDIVIFVFALAVSRGNAITLSRSSAAAQKSGRPLEFDHQLREVIEEAVMQAHGGYLHVQITSGELQASFLSVRIISGDERTTLRHLCFTDRETIVLPEISDEAEITGSERRFIAYAESVMSYLLWRSARARLTVTGRVDLEPSTGQ